MHHHGAVREIIVFKDRPVTLVAKSLMTTVNIIMNALLGAAQKEDVQRQNFVLINVSKIQIVQLSVALRDFVHY